MSASEDRLLRNKITSLLFGYIRTGVGTLIFFNRKLRVNLSITASLGSLGPHALDGCL